LRFTPDEAAAFLDNVLAAPLSPSMMALLDQRLEGWIAGLRLVTLSLGAGVGGRKRSHNDAWEPHCSAITPANIEVSCRVVKLDAASFAGDREADAQDKDRVIT
jgi:hypothetical protein